MNKKSLLGLIIFACLVTSGLFAGANYLISRESNSYLELNQTSSTEDGITKDTIGVTNSSQEQRSIQNSDAEASDTADIATQEPWLSTNPSDIGVTDTEEADGQTIAEGTTEELADSDLSDSSSDNTDSSSEVADASTDTTDSALDNSETTFSTSIDGPQLIYNCEEVDYLSYIPKIVIDSKLEADLNITNPSINVDATAAILFDANTKEVLFYKNAVQAAFPASTVKLLTALVAMDWCEVEEEVTIGDEITMIASDSTRAYLKQGQILTIRNLFDGMLLPSGNDAAYAIAAYVGRKSLQNTSATKEEAIIEFTRLMNLKATILGVKNSCFKTPDGYDAIGQYTTAYDMGLIGIAAAKNETIIEVSNQASSRDLYPSGEDITWTNTNKLIKKYSGQYYSHAIGLKTGTSTMAGRCLVAAAELDDKKVVCVIMDSTSAGRWEDAIALLKYGLGQ